VTGRHGLADRGDPVPFDRQVDIAQIDMGLHGLVPRDQPGGVADNLPRRHWLERLRHGIASRQIPRATSSGPRLRFESLVAWGKSDPRQLAAGPDVPGSATCPPATPTFSTT